MISLPTLTRLAAQANTPAAWLILLDHASRWRGLIPHEHLALAITSASQALNVTNELATAYVTGRWYTMEEI